MTDMLRTTGLERMRKTLPLSLAGHFLNYLEGVENRPEVLTSPITLRSHWVTNVGSLCGYNLPPFSTPSIALAAEGTRRQRHVGATLLVFHSSLNEAMLGTGFCYVGQRGLEFMILLPQPPKCCNYSS